MRRTFLTVLLGGLLLCAGHALGRSEVVRTLLNETTQFSGVEFLWTDSACSFAVDRWTGEQQCVTVDGRNGVERWGADFPLRKALAVDYLMNRLEGHPQVALVDARYRTGDHGQLMSSDSAALFVLEMSEGHLEVVVSPERSQIAQLTFRPNDLPDLCLAGPTEPSELFRLASSFDSYSEAEVSALFECVAAEPTDDYGQSPLFYAIAADNPGAVRAFLKAGFNPNFRAHGGWTPLMMAARDTTEPQVVLELLRAGAWAAATPDNSNLYSDTSLGQAWGNGNLLGDEAMIALTAALLLELGQFPAHTGIAPTVVSSGTAPFLPPLVANQHSRVIIEDIKLHLEGRTHVSARTVEGNDVFDEQIHGSGDVRAITFTGVYELDRQEYQVTANYVQEATLVASIAGEESSLDTAEFDDYILFEITEVHAGLLGERLVALGIPQGYGTREIADQLNVGVVGDFLVSTQLPLATGRLGRGAELQAFVPVEVEGNLFQLQRNEVLEEVDDSGFRVRIREVMEVPAITERDWGVTTTIAMLETSDSVLSFSYAEPLAYTTTGTTRMDTNLDIELEDFGTVSSRTQVTGQVTGSREVRDWSDIVPDIQRHTMLRILWLVTEKL